MSHRPDAPDERTAHGEGHARAPLPRLPLLMLLGCLLYTRFWRAEDVLHCERRDRLLHLVASDPGASPSALARRAGLARNTVIHHLRVLERARLVRVAAEGHARLVFPVGAAPAPLLAPLRASRHPATREVLALLQAHPEGLTRSQLHARMPRVPLRTLNYNVAKLVRAGMISQEPRGAAGGDLLRVAPAHADALRADAPEARWPERAACSARG